MIMTNYRMITGRLMWGAAWKRGGGREKKNRKRGGRGGRIICCCQLIFWRRGRNGAHADVKERKILDSYRALTHCPKCSWNELFLPYKCVSARFYLTFTLNLWWEKNPALEPQERMWKLFVKMYPEWLNKHPHLSTTEDPVLRLSRQLNSVFYQPLLWLL